MVAPVAPYGDAGATGYAAVEQPGVMITILVNNCIEIEIEKEENILISASCITQLSLIDLIASNLSVCGGQ